MTKLSDAELQALVYQTGITPCDRLPKPDPNYEMNALLHHISMTINGAVKAGDPIVYVSTNGFPKWSIVAITKVQPILRQLGYKVKFEAQDVGDRIAISGWL